MDKTPIKIIALIVIPLILAVIIKFVSWNRGDTEGGKSNKSGRQDLFDSSKKPSVKINTTWLLPDDILEVSGIAWVDTDRFACVQDEMGKVFIFNTRINKIEREIPFAKNGDYEGVAVSDDAIYVLQANGSIFEIAGYKNDKPKVSVYDTHLKKKQDAESLAYDKNNNRLLVAVKAVDLNSSDYKGIYAFDLASKQMAAMPVFKIDLKNEIFKDVNKGKIENSISPSDLAIHPLTGELYIIEGTKPKLLIMDTKGSIVSLYDLKGSDFAQPEGITFDPQGKMYISNEGNKQPGNILQVELADRAN
ncbi:MAG: SdiA-regulated domain-containing protein [Daejeonella sp.]